MTSKLDLDVRIKAHFAGISDIADFARSVS
jgi:hypothetical protein